MTSQYCGAYGANFVAGGRLLPKSIYIPNNEALSSVCSQVTDDELSVKKALVMSKGKVEKSKMRLGGDALQLAEPAAPAPTARPAAPVQSRDGFVYSLYANPDFEDARAFPSETDELSDDDFSVNESVYVREHDRLQRDALTYMERLEEANRKLAELEVMRTRSSGGKRVGFDAPEETASNTAVCKPAKAHYADIQSTYNFEADGNIDEPVQFHAKNAQLADSVYYGLPNNAVRAYNKPQDYHYQPAEALQAVDADLLGHKSGQETAVEDTEPVVQSRRTNGQDFAYSEYHMPSLRDQAFSRLD